MYLTKDKDAPFSTVPPVNASAHSSYLCLAGATRWHEEGDDGGVLRLEVVQEGLGLVNSPTVHQHDALVLRGQPELQASMQGRKGDIKKCARSFKITNQSNCKQVKQTRDKMNCKANNQE